jgi:hypothetical protein
MTTVGTCINLVYLNVIAWFVLHLWKRIIFWVLIKHWWVILLRVNFWILESFYTDKFVGALKMHVEVSLWLFLSIIITIIFTGAGRKNWCSPSFVKGNTDHTCGVQLTLRPKIWSGGIEDVLVSSIGWVKLIFLPLDHSKSCWRLS